MDRITAYVVFGERAKQGEGVTPSVLMFFTQDDSPTWTLYYQMDPEDPLAPFRPTHVWRTSEKNALDDMFLMLGTLVFHDTELKTALDSRLAPNGTPVAPLEGLDTAAVERLREHCRTITGPGKGTLTIQDDSVLLRQLAVLERYRMPVDLVMSIASHQASIRI